jgi:hypothetical protein
MQKVSKSQQCNMTCSHLLSTLPCLMCTPSIAPNHAFSLSVLSNLKLVFVALLLLPMIQCAISKETGSRTIYIALSSVPKHMTTDVLSTFLGLLTIQPMLFHSQAFDLLFHVNHFTSGPVSFFAHIHCHIFFIQWYCACCTQALCVFISWWSDILKYY